MSDRLKVCAFSGLGLVPFDPEVSFNHALEANPAVIAVDAGSGDIGPYYLGSGAEYNPRAWEKHDLEMFLVGAREIGVPLIIGSCAGSGTSNGVDRYAEIIREIADEHSLPGFRLAKIYSDIEKDFLIDKVRASPLEPVGVQDRLTVKEVEDSTNIVAMMGVHSILQALEDGAEVILAGRSCDDALHAAVPIHYGIPRNIAFLAGKTMENASMAATPFMAREGLLGTLTHDSLDLEPSSPIQVCTTFSVTAEIFYERRNPYYQAGPGGMLDLSNIEFKELTDRTVRLTGAEYIDDPVFKVRIEGAGFQGYRSLTVVGIRDPRMIDRIDDVLEGVEARIRQRFGDIHGIPFMLHFHVFGKNAILGDIEPVKGPSHELGVIIEVLAPSQEAANEIAIYARRANFLSRYEGQKATAGSVSYTVDEYVEAKPAYRWTIDHLLPIADPGELFSTRLELVGEEG